MSSKIQDGNDRWKQAIAWGGNALQVGRWVARMNMIGISNFKNTRNPLGVKLLVCPALVLNK
jgi:hypothetical protein